MRDVMVITPEDASQEWSLDIDVIEGYPTLVPEEQNNNDQRAALSAYQMKGTIPGMMDRGVDWANYYGNSQDSNITLVDINNQVQQNIQANVSSDSISTMYNVSYGEEKGRTTMSITKMQGDRKW